jgi:hypothetical protein
MGNGPSRAEASRDHGYRPINGAAADQENVDRSEETPQEVARQQHGMTVTPMPSHQTMAQYVGPEGYAITQPTVPDTDDPARMMRIALDQDGRPSLVNDDPQHRGDFRRLIIPIIVAGGDLGEGDLGTLGQENLRLGNEMVELMMSCGINDRSGLEAIFSYGSGKHVSVYDRILIFSVRR